MRKVLTIIFASCAILLAACDPQPLFNAFIPKEQSATGQKYLEDIRTRQFQPLEDRIDPAFKNNSLPSMLEKMASLFPREKPKSIKVVGSNTLSLNGEKSYNLTYEYEFPHG
jgi:hypothetical protein